MADSLDPIAYLSYLRRHLGFLAAAVSAATVVTAGVAWLLPKEYTASATLVIEPPAASDPRAATAVSSIYLESLKAYEQFAASDSLFAKACAEFGLLKGPDAPPVESFKRRVLKVTKLKDTKLLRIDVTLEDAEQAHRLAEYLARETVALNRAIASEADTALLDATEASLDGVLAKVEAAREEYNRITAGGNDRVWSEELLTLTDLKSRMRVELLAAQTRVAELRTRDGSAELAGEEARLATLTAAIAGIDREMAAKSAELADLRARQDRALAALRVEEAAYEVWSRRTTDLGSTSGSRTEQIRVVDPGIVPQRPSFPNIPLLVAVAVLLSGLLTVGFLSVRFGWEQTAAQSRTEAVAEPIEIRVARGGNR